MPQVNRRHGEGLGCGGLGETQMKKADAEGGRYFTDRPLTICAGSISRAPVSAVATDNEEHSIGGARWLKLRRWKNPFGGHYR